MSPEATQLFRRIGKDAADSRIHSHYWQVSVRRARESLQQSGFTRQEYYVVRSAFERRVSDLVKRLREEHS